EVYVVRNQSKYLDQWVAGTNYWMAGTNYWSAPGLPGGTYNWWVRSWNEAGYGPWSTNFTFTIQTNVPGAIPLLSPSGTLATGSTQRYTWKTDAAATWYELYVLRNDSACGNKWYTLPHSVADSVSGNFAVDVSGHTSGSYQWWVRGWGPDGMGPWSGPDSFSVQGP